MANASRAMSDAGKLTEGKLPTATSGAPNGLAANGNLWINDIDPYVFMRMADAGTDIFQNGKALSQYSRERDYDVRRNYSYYLPFTKRVIDALTDPIFREAPIRKVDAPDKVTEALVDNFINNANKAKKSLSAFMHGAMRNANRYGVEFIVVDNASTPAENADQAVKEDQRPYVYSISPEQVVEYGWDSNFNLNRIAFKDSAQVGRYDRAKGKEVEHKYRELTPGKWETYELDDEGNRKNVVTGVLGIKSFPVVSLYTCLVDHNDDPILPFPPLYHIARANLAVYDVCSEIRGNTRDQMFSLLVYPKTNKFDSNSIVTGTQNALGFDGENSKHAPEFISPDPDVMKAVMDDRMFIIQQIFEMASLIGVVGMAVKEESGRAKEIELQATRKVLTTRSNAGEEAEKEIFRLVGEYLKKPLTTEVNYSTNYDLVDEDGQIKRAESMLLMDISPEVNVAIKKAITATIFRNMKSDELKELLDSIDAVEVDKAHIDPKKDASGESVE